MKRGTLCLLLFLETVLCILTNAHADNWTNEDYKDVILNQSNERRFISLNKINGFDTGDICFLGKWILPAYNSGGYYIGLFLFDEQHKMQFFACGGGMERYNPAIIMRLIPGEHVFDDNVAIGDYNNDGRNELLCFGFWGSGYSFYIYGIDPATGEFGLIYEVPFYVDYPPTYSPVEFITYKGIPGFKISDGTHGKWDRVQYQIEGFRGIGWFFHTWDKEQQKYIEVGEVDPAYESPYSPPETAPKAKPVIVRDISLETPISDNEKQSITTQVLPVPADGDGISETTVITKDSLVLWVCIGAGILVVAIAIFLIHGIIGIKRRKNENRAK